MYLTSQIGYSKYKESVHGYGEEGYSIELEVEPTSKARFFKNQMEKEFYDVTVVNTNKFKVITSSTKKADQRCSSYRILYGRPFERFNEAFKKFAAYIGIVPNLHNSNDVVQLGRITKRGPQEL